MQLRALLRRSPAPDRPPTEREVARHRARLAGLLAGGADRHPSEIFAGVPDDFWLWANSTGRDEEASLQALLPGMTFPDAEGALAADDAGEFCFSSYDPDADPSTWGEACIPEAYVRERWGQKFEVVDFLRSSSAPTSGNGLLQHVVVLRR